MGGIGLRERECAPRRTRQLLLSATILTATACLLSPAAFAACAPPAGPGTPSSGTVVSCTGATTDQNAPNGYGDASLTGVTINVGAGASVTGTTTGIIAGAGSNTVANDGTVTGNGGTAVNFLAGNDNRLTLTPAGAFNGIVTGTGTGNIFQLGGTGSGTFDTTQIGPAAQYRGFATFGKIDGSIWTLTGTNATAMAWGVNGGTLNVNGTMASSTFTVNSGATLGGTGTVGATTVNSGGTIAPGTSIGTLTVNGSLTFQQNSNYIAEVTPLAADRITVTGGGATLTGRLSAVDLGGAYVPGQYTLLTATSGFFNTRFTSLATTPGSFSGLAPSLVSSGNTLFLNLAAATPQATWLQNPGSNDYWTGSNWTGGSVPNGTAFFNATNTPNIEFINPVGSPQVIIGSFEFGANAPAYTFAMQSDTVTFNGAGIVNNSLFAPTFNVGNRSLLEFINASTAGNATINAFGSVGQVHFRDNSTAANAVVTIGDGIGFGSMVFFENSTAANATVNNTFGTLIFRDNSTAGNATITNQSATIFSGSSSAGTATIANNAGGIRIHTNATADNATIINNAGAVVDVSNTNVPGGSPSVGIGSLSGAGNVFLGARNLRVGNLNLNDTISGVIADGGDLGGVGGSLTKAGSGTLTLSGANTYTGATTVNAGVLHVAQGGSIVSNTTVNGGAFVVNGTSGGVTINSGGTLGGTGTVGSTTINSGGTLSPGNSIGAINVNGNLVLGAGSVYLVEVSPNSADRTNVSGTAMLDGTVHAIFGPGSYTSNSYTILSAAGGRSGTFNSLTTQGLPATLSASLSYTATDVLLITLTSQIGPTLPPSSPLGGGTPNQRAVASAQDAAFNAGLANITALYNLSLAQIPAALDQLSGEVHASTAGVLVDESRYMRGAVLGRLRQASYGGNTQMASLSFGGPQAFAADGELNTALAYVTSPVVKAPMKAPEASRDVVFWAQGFGAWGRFDGDGNAASVRRDLAGFITGVDTRVGEAGRAGIAAGYTGSRNTLDGRGSADVETGHIGAYGGWSFGALNLRAGGSYSFHAIDTDRTAAFPGFFDRLTARYDGRTGQVFGEVGYGFNFASTAVEPFAGGTWVRLDTDGTVERGGVAALNVAASSFEVGYATLGVRAASIIALANSMVLIPRASLAWQHAFESVTPAARLAFAANGVPFTVFGVPIARDSLLAEAGLDLAISPNATVGVSYVGQVARNVTDHAAKGRFSWRF